MFLNKSNSTNTFLDISAQQLYTEALLSVLLWANLAPLF